MKKNRVLRWLLVLVLLTICITCIVLYLNPKKALKFVFPDLEQISLVKAKIKNDTAYLKVNAILQNKSFYTLNIDTLFYQVKLADTMIFTQTTALKLRQEKYQTDNVELPLKLPIKTIMRTIRSLQKQDSTEIESKVYVVYNTIVGRTRIPFTKVAKIRVPIPPQIKLEKMETKNFNLKKETIEATAHIKIINRGKLIDLDVHEIHYWLVLGNNLIHSQGVFQSPVVIRPQSTTDLTVPLLVHINKPFKVAWKVAVNKDRLPYKLKLLAKLDENNLYNKDDVPIELEAEGTMELVKKKK